MKLRCSIVWVIVSLIATTPFVDPLSPATLYVTHHNLFEDSFKSPYEIIFFVFYDGDVYGFTTRNERTVNWSIIDLVRYMKEQGKTAEDIAIVIHNHALSPRFSMTDRRCCKMLRQLGFKGAFLLYHCPTGKVIFLEE